MDSSCNFNLGFGGICGTHWMSAQWPAEMALLEPSIQYLELFAQTAGILAWGHLFRNKPVVIYCDNESVVSMINLTSSSCKNCMVLIRIVVYTCLTLNLKITAKWVSTKANEIADSLSRLNYKKFFDITKDMCMDSHNTEVPHDIWPPMDIWLN